MKKPAQNEDDDWNEVSEDRQKKRTKDRNAAKHQHWEKKQAEKKAKNPKVQLEMKQQVVDDDESSGLDDEEEGGEWITQENLFKYMAKGDVV